jgi:hypothetical protein
MGLMVPLTAWNNGLLLTLAINGAAFSRSQLWRFLDIGGDL